MEDIDTTVFNACVDEIMLVLRKFPSRSDIEKILEKLALCSFNQGWVSGQEAFEYAAYEADQEEISVEVSCSFCGHPFRTALKELQSVHKCDACSSAKAIAKPELPQRTGEARIEHLINKPKQDTDDHFEYFMGRIESGDFDEVSDVEDKE